ncbi:hypothetical protein F5Y07DRAFT_399405 [Xylaria sp. FL0933]|nr:hypothetical protein F5Y07DRAFT_399405 [Xylaria sp. FL0933]
MGVLHEIMPPPSNALAARHTCGCPGTNHSLPKLVSFFQTYGHEATSYSASARIPENLGLKSACLQCQMKTENGVEMAINAMHCGPDFLIDHGLVQAMFISLIDRRLEQKKQNKNINEADEERVCTSEESGSGTELEWDWDSIWHEFVKAFELRRNRADVGELLHGFSEITILRHQEWWCTVLQRLGAEALLTLEVYVSEGLVARLKTTELAALKRDIELIESAEDLSGVYVDIDRRIHGVVHARKMLRVVCL